MNIPTASIASYHPLHLQAALTCSHLCFLRVCFSGPILFHVLPYLYSVAVGASVCVLLCRGNVITERSASFSSCNGSSVCLYGCSAYARPIYNLDPFCVLDNLYSVAVDASIPLLFSHRVYRGSLSLVSSDTNERDCGIQHLTFSVISMSVAPTP